MRNSDWPFFIFFIGMIFVIVIGTSNGCATGTGVESGAVDISGARLDKLEKLFENLSLQIQTTNNTQAENIYGGAGWVVISAIGMIACLGVIAIVAFRSWLRYKRRTRAMQLLTSTIDSLPSDTKRKVTNKIKDRVACGKNAFNKKDEKNLRELVNEAKQERPNDVE